MQEVDEILYDSYTRIEHVITGYWLHALRGNYYAAFHTAVAAAACW
jgi:hypothetical protein